jgi:hypothetical protein
VYARHTQCVGKLILSYGQLVGVAVCQPDGPQAKKHLAEKMGHALLGRAGANVDQPLAQNRLINQGCPPERARKRWPFRHFQHAMAWNPDDLAGRQRPDGVIHRPQDEAVEIAEIRDMTLTAS